LSLRDTAILAVPPGDPDVANYNDFVKGNYDGPVWKQHQRRLTELNRPVTEANG
jgi:hypothetical protein